MSKPEKTNIPDAAVHAAAEAVYGCGFDGSPQREAWLRDFRVALEAAAAHMGNSPRTAVSVECHVSGAS